LSAVTAIGTFCRSSDRRRAVTTTSCRLPASALAIGALAVASGSAAAELPAAINQEKINALQDLRIMADPPIVMYDAVHFVLLNDR
jgi:hypothetical protein